MEMTSRERLTRIFNGEKPDRIGSTFLINPYYTHSLPGDPHPLDVLKDIGADILDRDCPLPYTRIFKNGVVMKDEYKDGITRVSYETKVGTVYETYNGKRAWGDLPFKSRSFIKTIEDYKILQYVFENTVFVPNYAWFEEYDNMIGDYGIVVPQITEFRSSLEYLCEDNVERTTYDLMDHPEIVEEFLSVLKEKNLEACRVAVESPASIFNIWEDTSTSLISVNWFKEYVLPEFKEFTNIVNDAGKKLIHHACGHIKNLLPLIATEDVAAIESITPLSNNGTGNVTIKECVEAWQGKFVMIGGLNSVALITYSMKELEAIIEQTLEDIGEYRHRYIIQNGDSLPPKVELEKLRFVIQKAKDYKIE
jgi:hypothetical protein